MGILRILAFLAALLPGAAHAQNRSDLWWNPLESGWGLAISDHETQLFAVWFTYDAPGRPTWFTCPGESFSADRRAFSGTLYRSRGPAYTAQMFDASRVEVTPAGTCAIDFAPAAFASGVARFTYTIDGIPRAKDIRRQPFGTSAPNRGRDRTDLWWNPAESGWGLSLTQHGEALFGVWFTYGADGLPTWFVIPSLAPQGVESFSGELYATTGPPYTDAIFDPARVRVESAGRAAFSFDATGGAFVSTVGVLTRSRRIERMVFGSAGPEVRGTVTVIDTATAATDTLPAGAEPVALALDAPGGRLYVANHPGDSVTVIDTTRGAVLATVPVASPSAIAFNPVTREVQVLSRSLDRITVLDANGLAIRTLAARSQPRAIAVDAASGRAYVANYGSNDVTVLGRDGTIASTIAVGSTPYALAVDPTTHRVYVANYGSDDVTVIDTNAGTTSRVPVGSGPSVVAVNPRTNRIYVANLTGGRVSIIDGASLATTTVATGSFPHAIAIDTTANRIYVANYRDASVTIIDGATHATSTVPAGRNPRAIVVDPAGGKAYVANEGSSTVTVIDGPTGHTASLDAGVVPFALVADESRGRIYVVNRNTSAVP